MSLLDEKLSVAPMLDWTDPHFRYLLRGFTKHTVLYTEMVVDETVLNTPSLDFFIGRYIEEDPSVVQVGGSSPELLAAAAEKIQSYSNCSGFVSNYFQGGNTNETVVAEWAENNNIPLPKSSGYGEINLNCGCPSQRVAKRCFGAKLMQNPELVRQICHEMSRRVSIPITVKCRIGVDKLESYEYLTNFIHTVSQSGVKKFIIHSRKCILKGLNAKQNRDIPPLKYEVVHRLVRDFPDLTFVLNGGIQTLEEAKSHIDNEYIYYPLQDKLNVEKKIYERNSVFVPTSLPYDPSVIFNSTSILFHQPYNFNNLSVEPPLKKSNSILEMDKVNNQEEGENKEEEEVEDVPYQTSLDFITQAIGHCFNEDEIIIQNSSKSVSSQFSEDYKQTLPGVHGVMLGRAVYNNPLLLANADKLFYNKKNPGLSRREILERYMQYAEWCQSELIQFPKPVIEDNELNKEKIRVRNLSFKTDTSYHNEHVRPPLRLAKALPSNENKKRNLTSPNIVQGITSSTLINAMRNVINGMPNVTRYRAKLNDEYIDRLRELKKITLRPQYDSYTYFKSQNPSPREVVSYYYLVLFFLVYKNISFLYHNYFLTFINFFFLD